MRLLVPDTFRCSLAPACQIGRTPLHIVRIGGQEMHVAFIEKTFRPIARLATEASRQRPGRDLHEHARLAKALDHRIAVPDPGQALRMCQDRNIASDANAKKQLFHPRRRHMMRRLHKNVARVVQAQEVTTAQLSDEIRDDVIVSAGNQPKRDPGLFEPVLHLGDGSSDRRTGIQIKTRQDVRCAGDNFDPIGDKRARHVHRDTVVRRPVIKAWKQMAMQINHGRWTTCLTFNTPEFDEPDIQARVPVNRERDWKIGPIQTFNCRSKSTLKCRPCSNCLSPAELISQTSQKGFTGQGVSVKGSRILRVAWKTSHTAGGYLRGNYGVDGYKTAPEDGTNRTDCRS